MSLLLSPSAKDSPSVGFTIFYFRFKMKCRQVAALLASFGAFTAVSAQEPEYFETKELAWEASLPSP